MASEKLMQKKQERFSGMRSTRIPRSRRAFIFTIDAIMSLALVSTLFVLLAFVSLPSPSNEKYFELEQLGFDSLRASHNESVPVAVSDADFRALTGLRRFSSYAAVPAGAAPVARARFYDYSALCGCASFPCSVSNNSACLSGQDLTASAGYSDVWVTP